MIPYKLVANRIVADWEIPGPGTLGGQLVLIDTLPGSESLKYIAIAKIDDIWALDRLIYAERSYAKTRPYILDLVEKEAGEDLRNNRCFLLIDMSTEGHPFWSRSFQDLHEWCESRRISRTKVAILSQNRALASAYKRAFGSGGVKVWVYDAFINALGEMLAAPDDIFFKRFGVNKKDSVSLSPDWIDHPFLCLNATPRAPRLATLAALRANGLLSRTCWSLLTRSSGKSCSDAARFLKTLKREDLNQHVEEIMRMPDQRIDSASSLMARDLVWTLPFGPYENTLITITVETDFTDGDVVRITEKTIKAFSMGHPVIVIGNPTSLQLTRELGFKTFSPLLHEAYDEIENPESRFSAALDELLRVNRLIEAEPGEFAARAEEAGRFNAEHARSGGLIQTYRQKIEQPLMESLHSELCR